MKHKIRVIGFDGKNYWKLFYIEVFDNKEVYYAFSDKRFKLSYSRHGSGEYHVKHNGQRINYPEDIPFSKKRKSLKDLDRIEHQGTFIPFDKEKLTDKSFKKYVSSQHNGLLLLDTRNYDGTVNIQLAIVKSDNKIDILNRKFDNEEQIYIYTKSNPWIVIYVLNVHPKINTTEAKIISKVVKEIN